MLFILAFKFNLRRYNEEEAPDSDEEVDEDIDL
jgi:hypothetical protein